MYSSEFITHQNGQIIDRHVSLYRQLDQRNDSTVYRTESNFCRAYYVSVTAVQNAFEARFPDRNNPTKRTIRENVKKYSHTGTSLNRKGSFPFRKTFLRNGSDKI